MRINKLKLYDFRCFEYCELKLSDRFTLLIGDNGSGKTAILDGFAITVGDFVEKFFGIPMKQRILQSDIRYEEMMISQSVVREIGNITSVKVSGVFNNQNVEWERYKNLKTNRQYVKGFNKLKSLTDTKIKSNIPVIAYYKTSRLWLGKPSWYGNFVTLSPKSRLFGYNECLSNLADNLKLLFIWFKTQELIALQEKQEIYILEAVRKAIINMIPDAKNVFWSIKLDELVIETEIQGKMQSLPFRLLSDGYRNMIGMVADIAYRMATLNPQLEKDVIKQTEGIVLIDEIDLHLHPKWQRIVVDRLLNTFPKVQFVATTHSPFIIQSLYERKDCLLWDLESNQSLEIDTQSIEDITESLQNVSIPQRGQRYQDMIEAAEKYYQKLHEFKGESNEELLQLKEKLDELTEPFNNDPAFIAQLKFERETVLASKGK